MYGVPAAVSPKRFVTTWVLSLLFGGIGADRFYLGKIGTGALKLVTLGGFGMWSLVDLILTLTGDATDGQGRKVRGTGREPAVAWAGTGAAVVIAIAVAAASSLGSAKQPSAFDAPTLISASSPSANQVWTSQAPTAPASQTSTSTAQSTATSTPTTRQPTTGPANGGGSISEQQAVEDAQEYLEFEAFSRGGLIDQLKFDGFSEADATAAVDSLNVDWNAEAKKAAQEYLDTLAFSRSGLISQLEFDKFTASQATSGVDALNADWNAEAVKAAQEYLNTMAFSRSELIDQLEFDGFTASQAAYGADGVGL